MKTDEADILKTFIKTLVIVKIQYALNKFTS
jgi:hypothetical protein